MMGIKKPAVRKKTEGTYHHGDLKTSLKRAALRLVHEKGPRGFSLNEASRLAGVSVAAPYRHFADKDALLAEVACDGCDLLTRDLMDAESSVEGTREQMLEVGMAYLGFAADHADYFAVIFSAGLDKKQYPALEQAASKAFGVIWTLSQILETTTELAASRAISAWALVHGLASLAKDGALSTAMPVGGLPETLRPVLRQFLNLPHMKNAGKA